jgi:hypothetical protein
VSGDSSGASVPLPDEFVVEILISPVLAFGVESVELLFKGVGMNASILEVGGPEQLSILEGVEIVLIEDRLLLELELGVQFKDEEMEKSAP